MPYIVSTAKYPRHISDKVADRYFEVIQKNPPDESLGNMAVPIAAKSTVEGIKVITILEVAEGKFEEAFIRTGEFQRSFSDIEGYGCSIDVYATLADSMAITGRSMPE